MVNLSFYILRCQIYGGGARDEVRSFFNGADEFLAFCGAHYSALKLLNNLAFDIKYQEIENCKYRTLELLLEYDFSRNIFSDRVVIYGAGIIGKVLYKKIKKFTSVMYFIDNDVNKIGSTIDGIPIISQDNLCSEKNIKVIISVVYDFKNIKKSLLNKFQREDIISVDDILKLNMNKQV